MFPFFIVLCNNKNRGGIMDLGEILFCTYQGITILLFLLSVITGAFDVSELEFDDSILSRITIILLCLQIVPILLYCIF